MKTLSLSLCLIALAACAGSGAGLPVAYEHFAVTCPRSVRGLDDLRATTTCQVSGADRNGAPVNSQITVLSEAGTVPREVQLGSAGAASIPYATTCPQPVDVAPVPGEFRDASCRVADPCADPDAPSVRTCNVRDGIATLVVSTMGSECFNDLNHNGVFDDGEFDPACDLGEPYLDENDNGKWDPPCSTDPTHCDPAIPGGEPFTDVDQNHTWTPPNGQWDAFTTIWRATQLVWTGAPVHIAVADLDAGSLPCGSGTAAQLSLGDRNGNVPVSDQASALTLAATGAVASAFPLADCSQVCTAGACNLSSTCQGGGLDAAGLPQFTLPYQDADATCPHAAITFAVDATLDVVTGGGVHTTQDLGTVASGSFQ